MSWLTETWNRGKDDVVSFITHAVGGGGAVAKDCWGRFNQAGIKMCDSTTGAVIENLPDNFGVPDIGAGSVIGRNARVQFLKGCKEKFAERNIAPCKSSAEAAPEAQSSIAKCQQSIKAYEDASANTNSATRDPAASAKMAYNTAVLCCGESKLDNTPCQVNYEQCTTLPDEKGADFCSIADYTCYAKATGCISSGEL